MLLEFQCKNFKSIGENIVFSMLSENTADYTGNDFIQLDNKVFLKKAAIYGANGSGKSNFVKAISFVKGLVSSSHTIPPERPVFCPVHKLFANQSSEFIIHFSGRNKIRYSYGFSILNGSINEEFLNYFPNGRITKIFNRNNDSVECGERFATGIKKVADQFLKNNRLLLSCAGMFSNIDEITKAFVFFDQDLIIYPGDDEMGANSWRVYSATTAMNDEKLKGMFVDFLKNAGNNALVGIKSTIKEEPFNEALLKIFNDEAIKKQLTIGKNYNIDVQFDYEKFKLGILDESLGNQKLFDLFFPLVDILQNGKVLICDEFERSLHPLIVEEIISLFSKNTNGAQLVFTTHDVSILHPDYFRRDEVWFTEIKGDYRTTNLYSLAELNGVRKEELFGKNYVKGKYFAVPIISKDNIEKIIFGGNA